MGLFLTTLIKMIKNKPTTPTNTSLNTSHTFLHQQTDAKYEAAREGRRGCG